MRRCRRRLGLLSTLLLALVAWGCSGHTAPPDGGGPSDDGNSQGDDRQEDDTILCASTEQCPDHMECRGGVCMPAKACSCHYECDKTKNERCNFANNLCETGAPDIHCESDCQCYTGESCVGGSCVPMGGDEKSCTIDTECEGNQVCEDGRCVPKACQDREDCQAITCLVCKEGECTAPPPVCQGDDDCCVGFHCNFGTCVPDPTGCRSDTDCEEPFPRCVEGNCVQQCITDIDCPLDSQICDETNHCVTPCCVAEDCDQGQWCDTGDCQCKPGCDANDDCNFPETCNYPTHECAITDCCGGCEPTQYCNTISCQCVDMCQGPNDCPPNFECKTDGRCWCTEGSCPSGTRCNLATGECEQDTCDTNADCPTGWICNQQTHACEASDLGGEGDFCLLDQHCDRNSGLLCDSALFCIACLIADSTFVPTFTCRYECSLLLKVCPDPTNHQCLLRHLGFQGLCMPP